MKLARPPLRAKQPNPSCCAKYSLGLVRSFDIVNSWPRLVWDKDKGGGKATALAIFAQTAVLGRVRPQSTLKLNGKVCFILYFLSLLAYCTSQDAFTTLSPKFNQ